MTEQMTVPATHAASAKRTRARCARSKTDMALIPPMPVAGGPNMVRAWSTGYLSPVQQRLLKMALRLVSSFNVDRGQGDQGLRLSSTDMAAFTKWLAKQGYTAGTQRSYLCWCRRIAEGWAQHYTLVRWHIAQEKQLSLGIARRLGWIPDISDAVRGTEYFTALLRWQGWAKAVGLSPLRRRPATIDLFQQDLLALGVEEYEMHLSAMAVHSMLYAPKPQGQALFTPFERPAPPLGVEAFTHSHVSMAAPLDEASDGMDLMADPV